MINYIFDKKDKKFIDMVPDFNKMKNFPNDTPLLLFEEIKPDMIEEIPLRNNSNSVTAEIGNGDIICFQKALTQEQYVYIYNNI